MKAARSFSVSQATGTPAAGVQEVTEAAVGAAARHQAEAVATAAVAAADSGEKKRPL